MTSDDLVAVEVLLGPETPPGSERLLARPLGGQLFEIAEITTFAPTLNFGDVVRCDETSPTPRVADVVKRSGHATVRVSFRRWSTMWDPRGKDTRSDILNELHSMGLEGRCGTERLCAFDVPPGVSLSHVLGFLDKLVAYARHRARKEDTTPQAGPQTLGPIEPR